MPSCQFVILYFDILFRHIVFQKGIKFLENLFVRDFTQFSARLHCNLHAQNGNARSGNNQCFRIDAFAFFRNKMNPTLFIAPERLFETNKQLVKQRNTYSIDSLNIVLGQLRFKLYCIALQNTKRKTTYNFLRFVLIFISVYCSYVLVVFDFQDSLIEIYLWLKLFYKKFHHFIVTTSWNYIISHRFELCLYSRKLLDLCTLYISVLIYHPLKNALQFSILKFQTFGNQPLSQLVQTHILLKH